MSATIAFRQDETFPYPEFVATVAGGTYQVSKPPFAQNWRAAFIPDLAAGERTLFERVGSGAYASYDDAVAACRADFGRRAAS